MPNDGNIEIFADPDNFGKCFWISKGQVHTFMNLPFNILSDLCDELLSDKKAIAAMRVMGIKDENEMLELYNYCNRGKLDSIPDISSTGKKTREYVVCGRKGHCPGEGKVCSPLSINGSRITHRELECLELIGSGLTYKRITTQMGFRHETAVNSLTDRLRDKLQCCNNTEIALKVRELGIV